MHAAPTLSKSPPKLNYSVKLYIGKVRTQAKVLKKSVQKVKFLFNFLDFLSALTSFSSFTYLRPKESCHHTRSVKMCPKCKISHLLSKTFSKAGNIQVRLAHFYLPTTKSRIWERMKQIEMGSRLDLQRWMHRSKHTNPRRKALLVCSWNQKHRAALSTGNHNWRFLCLCRGSSGNNHHCSDCKNSVLQMKNKKLFDPGFAAVALLLVCFAKSFSKAVSSCWRNGQAVAYAENCHGGVLPVAYGVICIWWALCATS